MPQIQYVWSQINWSTLLDIAVVSVIFYWLLAVVQGTRAVQLVRGIIILWLASALLYSIFQLSTLTWLINNSGVALLVAIPIIFQPELRRALEQLGRTSTWLNRGLLGGQEQRARAAAGRERPRHGGAERRSVQRLHGAVYAYGEGRSGCE